jgi:hypothetical protein
MNLPNQGNPPRLARWLLAGQAAYFLLTGLWPLIHIDSFLAVTGPKVDVWLVETVGVLVSSIGAALAIAAARDRAPAEIVVLALGSAIGLATIEVIYVVRDRIGEIYLLDVAVEAVIVTGWVVVVVSHRKQSDPR